MDTAPMLPGRRYGFQLGHAFIAGQITELRHAMDIATGTPRAARSLARHEIGFANVSLATPAAFDPYRENRHTGAFLIIDRTTNATAGCGMIAYPLRRAANLVWQSTVVDKAARAALKGQKPAILWFTGLSGSGKSAVANAVEQMLTAQGRHTVLLDGDNIRHGLNRDLGFTDADRVENIRRVAEVAKLMVDAGLIVLVAFISPFAAERAMARALVQPGEFLEIHVATPLAVCETRDSKGLYRKARAGQLKNFTGIDSPYEAPEHPELRIGASGAGIGDLAEEVMALLRRDGIVPGV
jgi:bifunctional enzyme CysN/CysC